MKVGELVGHRASIFKHKSDPVAWVAPELAIGIEIELENPKGTMYRTPELMNYWQESPDGSLRDNGRELTLINPLFGVDLTNALLEVEKIIAAAPDIVFNYRTGLHIHVDCRDMAVDELKRFFLLYALFERSIFNFVGDNRNNNNFCAPWSRISDHLDPIFAALEGNSTKEEARETLKKTERYSALNCNALTKFGSVEFRHMQMTRDFVKIREWINIIMSLWKASLTGSVWGPTTDFQQIIKNAAKGGMREMARGIFPPTFLKFIDDYGIWEGILLAQDISIEIQQPTKFADSSTVIKSICPFPGTHPGFAHFKQNFSKES